METGVSQLHLRLHPCRADDGELRRRREQVPQQRRLAHPRLAAQHQRPALAAADRRDQVVQQRTLARPAAQAAVRALSGKRSTHVPLHSRRGVLKGDTTPRSPAVLVSAQSAVAHRARLPWRAKRALSDTSYSARIVKSSAKVGAAGGSRTAAEGRLTDRALVSCGHELPCGSARCLLSALSSRGSDRRDQGMSAVAIRT